MNTQTIKQQEFSELIITEGSHTVTIQQGSRLTYVELPSLPSLLRVLHQLSGRPETDSVLASRMVRGFAQFLDEHYHMDEPLAMKYTDDYLYSHGVTPQPMVAYVNELVQMCGEKKNVSDGYHTFQELYDHRIALFIALCRRLPNQSWRSKQHDDGTMFDGSFIAGIEIAGKQATYHLPIEKWEELSFAATVDKAPKWDGHTPQDVIERLSGIPTPTSQPEGESAKPATTEQIEIKEVRADRSTQTISDLQLAYYKQSGKECVDDNGEVTVEYMQWLQNIILSTPNRSPEATTPAVKQTETVPMDFVLWYSGMSQEKIQAAFARWENEVSPASPSNERYEKVKDCEFCGSGGCKGGHK